MRSNIGFVLEEHEKTHIYELRNLLLSLFFGHSINVYFIPVYITKTDPAHLVCHILLPGSSASVSCSLAPASSDGFPALVRAAAPSAATLCTPPRPSG